MGQSGNETPTGATVTDAPDEQEASAGSRPDPRRYRIHYEAVVKR